MTLNVFPAFAVPMAEVFHPEPAALNKALMQLILTLEAQGGGYRNPDPVVHQPAGLFESEFDFFVRDEPCVQQLRGWVWSSLGEFLRDINPSLAGGTQGLRIASQTWFHVTRDGGYFGYHNHPMASWSGVYCVSDGEPSPNYSNNGCLVFPHPQIATNTFMDAAQRDPALAFQPRQLRAHAETGPVGPVPVLARSLRHSVLRSPRADDGCLQRMVQSRLSPGAGHLDSLETRPRDSVQTNL